MVNSYKFLTNAPIVQKLATTDEIQLSFITTEASVNVKYTQYNLSGVAQTPAVLANVVLEWSQLPYRIGTVPINSTLWDATVSKVDVVLMDATGLVEISEVRIFEIDRTCYKNPIRLMWLNLQGGMDYYTFFATDEEVLKIEKATYKTSNVKKTYRSDAVKNIKVEGKYENEDTIAWLQGLYYSPEVYMIDSSYTLGYVPVNILQDEVLVYSNELFAPTCTIELQKIKINGN